MNKMIRLTNVRDMFDEQLLNNERIQETILSQPKVENFVNLIDGF